MSFDEAERLGRQGAGQAICGLLLARGFGTLAYLRDLASHSGGDLRDEKE